MHGFKRPTIPNMITPTELRPLAHNVILAGSALLPFTHGTGRDSHGNPVPHGDPVTMRNGVAV